MTDRVFLTEKREQLLNGEYEGSPENLRAAKYRLRKSCRTALRELIAVAESEEIESADVFEPNDLARLIDYLMVPSGGLTPRWNYDGDPEEFREEYLYQIQLHSRLNHALDGYGKMLHRDYPPGEHPPAWTPPSEDS